MRGQPQLFTGFVGGVNTEDAPYLLQDNEARDARNVISTGRGAIRKRNGAVTFATPSVALHSLFPMNTQLVGAGGTALYKIDTAGTVTSLGVTVTTAKRWEFIQAVPSGGQGPLFGVNGTDTPKHWTGTGSAASWTASTGAVPNGKFILYHGNRVWVSGVAANPSRIYFSGLGDPRNWPAANVFDLDPNDGGEITGLGTFGPYVFAFKADKAWVIYDLDTGANRRLGENIGCVAPRSIVETPLGTYFLSRDSGVVLTDGSTLKRVSDKLRPHIDSMVTAQRVNAAGAYHKDHYYLSICTTGSTNNLTLDLDQRLEAWWIHTHLADDFAVWDDATIPGIYSSKPGVTTVDRAFATGIYQDNGSNYSAYWSGPFHTFGAPFLRKRITQIHFDGKGTIEVSLARDMKPTPETLLDTKVLSETDVTEARVFTPGAMRGTSVKFGNSSSSFFEVDSYTVALTMRKN